MLLVDDDVVSCYGSYLWFWLAIMLPIEEPPVLLRHYTGHDTIAFVYVHTATHVTVAPPPRPGPASEQQKTIEVFSSFYSRARYECSCRISMMLLIVYCVAVFFLQSSVE